MISDDTIVSEANVAYVANKGNEIRQLKFIESTGTQYIDTGYIPNNNTKLDITFFTTGQSSLGGICVTNLNANNQQGFGIYVNATNYGNEIFVDDGTVKSFNREYKIHAILDKNQFYKNEVLVGTFSTSTFTCNNTLPIFCLNRNGSIEQFSKTKLYECKLYDNDVLVRDFIPAKQGNKVGLWENVDGVFYGNSGTGSFVAGPEVLYDSSYQELEYIEGNATNTNDGPYIDTGNILNQDAVVIADYQFVNTTNWISCAIFGSRSSADNNCFGFMARNDSTTPNETSLAMRWDYRNTQTKTASGALNKERELVTACKNELRFKNSSVLTASYSTFTCNNSLLLLAYYSQGKLDSCANAKLYSALPLCFTVSTHNSKLGN